MKITIKNVLVVEDDEQIANFICYALHNADLTGITAGSISEALDKMNVEEISMVILDLGLPDGDGKALIRQIREISQIPVIVVSARDREEEKVKVLDIGADDYITKPFSAAELIARVKVACRHIQMMTETQGKTKYKVRELELDDSSHLVHLKGEELHVTPMEYKLLLCLLQNTGKVVTTKTIIKTLWGAGYGDDTQALRALMAGLRRKIEENPGKPRYIITEIGVGYRLLDD